MGGRFLLRIEDIDRTRCRPEFEAAIFGDLAWLGLDWEEPVRRQSEHLGVYAAALERLKAMGLVYPAVMTRGEIRAAVAAAEAKGQAWPRDPDGTPLYPGRERGFTPDEQAALWRAAGLMPGVSTWERPCGARAGHSRGGKRG